MDVALSFLDAGGVERRERFDAATEVLYEEAQTFPSFKVQRNHPALGGQRQAADTSASSRG